MRDLRRWLATGIAAAVAATLFVAAPANAAEDAAREVVVALETVDARNGNLVIDAEPSVADADSAAQTPSVDIPTDPTKGIKLKSADGKTLTIRMPGARKEHRGVKHNGKVVFGSSGDSVDAAVAGKNSAQVWRHIRNKRATEDYAYCVDGVSRFEVGPTGAAIGLDKAGKPITVVPPPTATEKNTGKSVPTSYKAAGNCLVQHVAHKKQKTNYPVVADPWFQWQWYGGIFYFSRGETSYIIDNGQNAIAVLFGVWTSAIGGVVIYALIDAAKRALRSNQCLAVVVPWATPFFYRC